MEGERDEILARRHPAERGIGRWAGIAALAGIELDHHGRALAGSSGGGNGGGTEKGGDEERRDAGGQLDHGAESAVPRPAAQLKAP
ncbi:hypothetical protein LNKW23_01130 [Paralimibaculum aggregatum]|uniref:Uncharacterized protein n=1 Tax=Paralimibaculum aggregatum TaxID=3036245 RepID=A0ABQ6LKG7_9RHOB|nr:hypothetical protein LNKW23_01130 [Limibaculum sp. NKW23]